MGARGYPHTRAVTARRVDRLGGHSGGGAADGVAISCQIANTPAYNAHDAVLYVPPRRYDTRCH